VSPRPSRKQAWLVRARNPVAGWDRIHLVLQDMVGLHEGDLRR